MMKDSNITHCKSLRQLCKLAQGALPIFLGNPSKPLLNTSSPFSRLSSFTQHGVLASSQGSSGILSSFLFFELQLNSLFLFQNSSDKGSFLAGRIQLLDQNPLALIGAGRNQETKGDFEGQYRLSPQFFQNTFSTSKIFTFQSACLDSFLTFCSLLEPMSQVYLMKESLTSGGQQAEDVIFGWILDGLLSRSGWMPEAERRDMRLLLWSKRFLDSLSSETTLSLWRRIGSSEGVRLLLMGESSVRRVTLYFSALRSGPTQPAQAPIAYDQFNKIIIVFESFRIKKDKISKERRNKNVKQAFLETSKILKVIDIIFVSLLLMSLLWIEICTCRQLIIFKTLPKLKDKFA